MCSSIKVYACIPFKCILQKYTHDRQMSKTATKLFKSVILGAPASGKGTISARIVKSFSLVHVSSGDKLRQNIQEKTPIGLEAEQYILAGKLVPDETMIKFITTELAKISKESWLLDGFPRTVAQAEALWKVQTMNLALNLQVPNEVIIARVKGRRVHLSSGRVYNETFNAPKVPGKDDVTGEPLIQRDDDKPEVVLKRLEQYKLMAGPLLTFYREKKILRTFCGEKTDEIWPRIMDCLVEHNIPSHK